MELIPKEVKETLDRLIHEIAEDSSLCARNPKRDFTRKRKLPVERVISILLGMGKDALPDELIAHFNYASDAASAPAFVQQRAKLRPEAMEAY